MQLVGEASGTGGRKSPLSLPLSFFLSLSPPPPPPRSFPERKLLIPSWGNQSILVRLESKSEDIFQFSSVQSLKDHKRKYWINTSLYLLFPLNIVSSQNTEHTHRGFPSACSSVSHPVPVLPATVYYTPRQNSLCAALETFHSPAKAQHDYLCLPIPTTCVIF